MNPRCWLLDIEKRCLNIIRANLWSKRRWYDWPSWEFYWQAKPYAEAPVLQLKIWKWTQIFLHDLTPVVLQLRGAPIGELQFSAPDWGAPIGWAAARTSPPDLLRNTACAPVCQGGGLPRSKLGKTREDRARLRKTATGVYLSKETSYC